MAGTNEMLYKFNKRDLRTERSFKNTVTRNLAPER